MDEVLWSDCLCLLFTCVCFLTMCVCLIVCVWLFVCLSACLLVCLLTCVFRLLFFSAHVLIVCFSHLLFSCMLIYLFLFVWLFADVMRSLLFLLFQQQVGHQRTRTSGALEQVCVCIILCIYVSMQKCVCVFNTATMDNSSDMSVKNMYSWMLTM